MVVVNTHLYGAHLASGGAVLPPHEVVVFDEAHEVEEVMTDSLGVEIGPGRFRALAASVRTLLDPGHRGRWTPSTPCPMWPSCSTGPSARSSAGRSPARPSRPPAHPAPGTTAVRNRRRIRRATSIRPRSSSDWPALLRPPPGCPPPDRAGAVAR